MPKRPASNNQTELPSLASLVWEPPADQQFLVSCLSVSQRSPLVPGASPLPCSPTSKSPSITQDLRGTDGALLVGTCCVSHALPRDELESVLLAAGGLYYPSRGWEKGRVSWPGLYPPAVQLCRDSGCFAMSTALGRESLSVAKAKCQQPARQNGCAGGVAGEEGGSESQGEDSWALVGSMFSPYIPQEQTSP